MPMIHVAVLFELNKAQVQLYFNWFKLHSWWMSSHCDLPLLFNCAQFAFMQFFFAFRFYVIWFDEKKIGGKVL